MLRITTVPKKGEGAHLLYSRSRNSWALDKAGWMDMNVVVREMFPPGRAGTIDAATFLSVPSCRARILFASLRLHVNSAAHWVGQGGSVSGIPVNHEEDAVWSSGRNSQTLTDVCQRKDRSVRTEPGSRF